VKPFSFKNFNIQQSENVFRVGTDGVLLGALANVEDAATVLEVGTGTGLITLMLAQRSCDSEFLGIDISKEAYNLTKFNFENAPFHSRLNNILKDFKAFETEKKFDLIVSNPPYFEASSSEKDRVARQTVELNFKQLISKSSVLLSEKGVFSVIIPAEAGYYFTEISRENKLFLNRKINIKGIETSKTKRLILEFSLADKGFEESDFVIEKSPRQYSDQYFELTREFHIFKNK